MHTHDHSLSSVPVLDIGGDIGALLVYLGASTPSGELDIQPLGRPEARFHTGVHHRHLAGGEVYTALYPEVTRGRYEILDHTLQRLAIVDVEGGAVTELDLRMR